MRAPWWLLLALPAVAHRGDALETEHEVPDPTISWALQGSFVTGDEVFTVRIAYDAPFATPFEIMTPHRERDAEFRPRFAVVAPGLPAPTDAERAALPRALPEGAGAFVELNDDAEREPYFEGVLRHVYWTSGTTAIRVPAGTTEVWIWSPDGDAGSFLFALGVEEDFTGPLEEP